MTTEGMPERIWAALDLLHEIKAQLRTHVEFDHATRLMAAVGDMAEAARAYLETALSSPPAAPTTDNNGFRVLAYDAADFISDSKTPTEMLFRPATVKVWRFDEFGRLLADVVFDHGREGGGLFANCLQPLPPPPAQDKGE